MSTHLCTYVTRKHTIYRSKDKETQSVHHSESILRDHILPVGENTRKHDEWIFLHLSDEITYFLVRKYETPWAQHSAPIPRDYLLPVGRNTRRDREHNILHRSDEITYQLWTKTQHDTIIRPLLIHPTKSRTVCGRKHIETPWAHHSASIRLDHVQSVGEDTRWNHEHTFLIYPTQLLTSCGR